VPCPELRADGGSRRYSSEHQGGRLIAQLDELAVDVTTQLSEL
jgi:hypothetical protein